jgi:hypothetical protein
MRAGAEADEAAPCMEQAMNIVVLVALVFAGFFVWHVWDSRLEAQMEIIRLHYNCTQIAH